MKSFSSRETAKLGSDLAAKLKPRGKTAAVFALEGDLGAGKTTFTQGFARKFGIKRRLISPTFVIMRRYPIPGRRSQFKNLYHIDAYRLKNPDALEILGFKEIAADPRAIVLIEWPENVKKILPKSATWLMFRHGEMESHRTITKNHDSKK